eukprot:m.127619 g.127619  ORF g.127619 m.127619 type:complete len:276 (+) comp29288_c0_seq2:345-1172(+)
MLTLMKRAAISQTQCARSAIQIYSLSTWHQVQAQHQFQQQNLRQPHQKQQIRYKSKSFIRRIFGIKDEEEAERQADLRSKRKTITKNFRKGFWGDVKEIDQTQGKTSIAPETLTKADEAELFPTMKCTAMSGRPLVLPKNWHGKVTLVTVGFRDYARPMLDTYRNHFLQTFPEDPMCQVYEVWIVERLVFRFMAKMFETNLKKITPVEYQDQTVYYSGSDAETLKQDLEVSNPVTGYVFLVDKRGRIRWQAHGPPTPEELITLTRGTSELLVSRR